MNLLQLFEKCLYTKYNHVENSGDYMMEYDGSTLYIYLECSNGKEDWKNNFDFLPTISVSEKGSRLSKKSFVEFLKQNISLPQKPYKHMKNAWFAHRGFLRVWRSIKPYIEDEINNICVKDIVIVGYSHGAALAALCHEYIWFNRPDLREHMSGVGFGCPRVFWGWKSKRLSRRWERFTVVRNINDIVTHVPPSWLGYSHVGKLLTIGQKKKYSLVDAHKPENIKTELHQYVKELA